MPSLSPDTTTPAHNFLTLPVEIRLKIYTLIFHCADTLLIEPANPTYQQSLDDESHHQQEATPSPTWQMRMSPIQLCRPAYLTTPYSTTYYGLGLSSQLLLTCRKLHSEALALLYTLNKFNCSMRSAPTILHRIISTANFARIRHLVLDWDQLQDFAWSLAKEEQVLATAGLEILELNHFRTRMLNPPRTSDLAMNIHPDPHRARTLPTPISNNRLWENTRDHERQIHQAALEITQKHAQLRVVLQEISVKTLPRGFQREEIPPALAGHVAARPIPELKVTARIRWRFVTQKGLREVKENEVVLNVADELAVLNVTGRN